MRCMRWECDVLLVVAVDIASEAINRLNSQVASSSNLTFVCADFTNLAEDCPSSLRDKQFGTVFLHVELFNDQNRYTLDSRCMLYDQRVLPRH